ncbi:LuxR C-terminal-related transcriptional regulator [Arhodomonas sp. AD133]|uniref:helix-turn-helix transcriptional regulator n=1 Tax=Arhodomonas sp. AD133 TaxID=3415009 RepID=UPI003EBF681A
MLTTTQWRAAQQIVAEAAREGIGGDMSRLVGHIHSMVEFERFKIYSWDVAVGDSLQPDDLSCVCIRPEGWGDFHIDPVQHLSIGDLEHLKTVYEADSLIDDIRHCETATAYGVSRQYQRMLGACREAWPDQNMARELLLVFETLSRQFTEELRYLTECTLPAIATCVQKHFLDIGRHLGHMYPNLTTREKQVLRLAACSTSALSISDSLGISKRTVHFHLQNIYKKIGVRRRHEAIICAQKSGFFTNE